MFAGGCSASKGTFKDFRDVSMQTYEAIMIILRRSETGKSDQGSAFRSVFCGHSSSSNVSINVSSSTRASSRRCYFKR